MPSFAQTGLLIASAMAMIGVGAWATYGEFAAFSMNVSSPARQYESIMALSVPPPSISSQREVALTCGALLFSIYPTIQSGNGQADIEAQCASLVTGPTISGGADPLGWSTLARIAGLEGDYAAMNGFLEKSFATGPNENWLAMNRFATGEKFWDELTPQVQANHEADIRLMLGSTSAMNTLALEYLARPDFAERLVAIVETMPESIQRRFVAQVRRTTQNLAGGRK